MIDALSWVAIILVVFSLATSFFIIRFMSRRLKPPVITTKTLTDTVFDKPTYGKEGRHFVRSKTPRSTYCLLVFFMFGIIIMGWGLISGGTFEFPPWIILIGLLFLVPFTLFLSIAIRPRFLYIYSLEKIDVPTLVNESLTEVGITFNVEATKPEKTTMKKATRKLSLPLQLFEYFLELIAKSNTADEPLFYKTPVVVWPKINADLETKKFTILIIEEYCDESGGLWTITFEPKIYQKLSTFINVLEKKIMTE